MTKHSDDLLHIASCRTCRDRFTADNVVTFDADRHREPERMREFLETARRLERERSGVQDVVARLLRTTPTAEWSTLTEVPELQSSAAVEQLVEEVRSRAERRPAEALTLANVATSIAEALPTRAYPPVVLAQLRATAWKETAQELRYVGRVDDALTAIETAERCLADFAAAAFDRAVVFLTKARIVHQLGRAEEAYALLQECRQVFEDHGDTRMLVHAGIMEGSFLYDDGHVEKAEALFNQLLPMARSARDTDSQARIENNLGYCATHAGDFRRANVHFSNGIALFHDLGALAEATRAERGAGRILVSKGQVSAGLAYLRDARRSFRENSMLEDAVLCGLEILEILVDRGETASARELAHQVSQDVAASSLGTRGADALSRLETALTDDANVAGPEVRDVHAYLKTLRESAQAS
jgi:tetratricopeptide (TPR) repeat protein